MCEISAEVLVIFIVQHPAVFFLTLEVSIQTSHIEEQKYQSVIKPLPFVGPVHQMAINNKRKQEGLSNYRL